MIENDGQICNTCNIWKPYSEFYNDKIKESGYKNICKKCLTAIRLADYTKDKTGYYKLTVCPICKNQFKKYKDKHSKKYCSSKCAEVSEYRAMGYEYNRILGTYFKYKQCSSCSYIYAVEIGTSAICPSCEQK